jgi:hypothetical protein
MCRFFSRKNKLNYLRRYLDNIRKNMNHFPEGYLSSKTKLISTIEWLVAYYENRAGCTPKEYLKTLIDNDAIDARQEIKLLYYWINHSAIVGF